MEYEWRISRQVAGLGLPVPVVCGEHNGGGAEQAPGVGEPAA
ncbi:hypothetical protein [Paenibacillus elgii]|nr:hypothetical protein [Paenibacillus elgii]